MNREQHKVTGIKRGGVSSIDFNLRFRDIQRYCPKCEALGIKNAQTLLGPRIYLNVGTRIPADSKDWKQCYLCGHIVHKVHINKNDGELVSEIEELNSPYDEVSGRIGGIDKRKLRKRGKHESSKIELIHDADVKEALRKGAKLISYSETRV